MDGGESWIYDRRARARGKESETFDRTTLTLTVQIWIRVWVMWGVGVSAKGLKAVVIKDKQRW